jgi:hypothetical protein
MKAAVTDPAKAEAVNHGSGYPFDPAADSAELEAELLKCAKGPFSPYSRKEMQALGERVIREKSRQ